MIAAARQLHLQIIVTLAAMLFAFASAFAQDVQGEPMLLPVDPAPLVVDGGSELSIEVAEDFTARQRGLMFRTEMDDDRGMLFVFEETQPVVFWMKNTPLPLDLVFIGEDGLVKAVLPGEPYSTDGISPGVPVRFVLEVKRGIAEKAGIADGVRLRHPRIDEVAGT
jgi:uncharacterized protein